MNWKSTYKVNLQLKRAFFRMLCFGIIIFLSIGGANSQQQIPSTNTLTPQLQSITTPRSNLQFMKFKSQQNVQASSFMGNHRQALQLIVSKLQDVEYAIQFCKEHNYDSLWHELIDYSLQKPSKITAIFVLKI